MQAAAQEPRVQEGYLDCMNSLNWTCRLLPRTANILIDWMVVWLIEWSFDWLIDWFMDWLKRTKMGKKQTKRQMTHVQTGQAVCLASNATAPVAASQQLAAALA